MATPTSAWARAGASLVPSPVMATRRPPACSERMRAILSSGVASARKSSTPASRGDGRRGERVVAGDHHGADAQGPELVEALGHALLHHVLRGAMTPRTSASVGHQRAGCRRRWRCPRRCRSRRVGHGAALVRRPSAGPSRWRPCGPRCPAEVDAAHAGLGGEGHEGRPRSRSRSVEAEPLLGQDHDRAALRGLVGQAGELGRRRPGVGHRPRAGAGTRRPAGCRRVMVPVLSSSRVEQSPAASTARPDMASTLCCTSRSMPAMPMADSSAADRGRDQADQQGDQHDDVLLGAGVDGEGLQGDDGQQEDDGEAGQQDVEGDLVRGLLALGPLDQADHAVEEGLAGSGGDAHHDLVGQHAWSRRSPRSGRRPTRG